MHVYVESWLWSWSETRVSPASSLGFCSEENEGFLRLHHGPRNDLDRYFRVRRSRRAALWSASLHSSQTGEHSKHFQKRNDWAHVHPRHDSDSVPLAVLGLCVRLATAPLDLSGKTEGRGNLQSGRGNSVGAQAGEPHATTKSTRRAANAKTETSDISQVEVQKQNSRKRAADAKTALLLSGDMQHSLRGERHTEAWQKTGCIDS
ncbi:hypothetical protein TGMAS_251470 [Toxoplasma gondii MAS]|uniref:Uncharacterized protein n=2 Tax=Toxoplasma gondii TaxID=5811 RepID=A0A086PWB8_TOXGO|nr:hypothetical protein TGMAS_251470 [Toxoplasma gondii MAS]PUA83807.1 hypothetical protein TGBR9_251470 [Toxoplasma gondii TgCATBr9]